MIFAGLAVGYMAWPKVRSHSSVLLDPFRNWGTVPAHTSLEHDSELTTDELPKAEVSSAFAAASPVTHSAVQPVDTSIARYAGEFRHAPMTMNHLDDLFKRGNIDLARRTDQDAIEWVDYQGWDRVSGKSVALWQGSCFVSVPPRLPSGRPCWPAMARRAWEHRVLELECRSLDRSGASVAGGCGWSSTELELEH